MKHQIIQEIHCLDTRSARELEKLSVAQEVYNVTGGNGRIISFLVEHEHEDIYQKDIEKAFGTTRSTASRVLGLMEQKGLIERRGVAHDARLKKVTLTDRSRALGTAMIDACGAVDGKLLSGFTHQEIETLHKLLLRMQKNLE